MWDLRMMGMHHGKVKSRFTRRKFSRQIPWVWAIGARKPALCTSEFYKSKATRHRRVLSINRFGR